MGPEIMTCGDLWARMALGQAGVYGSRSVGPHFIRTVARAEEEVTAAAVTLLRPAWATHSYLSSQLSVLLDWKTGDTL